MTISDDRLLLDNLTRGQAILFLVRQGADHKKLSSMNDDALLVAYEVLKRRELRGEQK